MNTNLKLVKWKRCKRCGLHKHRRNVVLGRGDLPCDILFIGESPNKNEDLLNSVFTGQAGKLLDYILQQAAAYAELPLPKVYFTNSCACRTCDGLKEPSRPPKPSELWGCFERLREEISLAKAKRVVLLGKVAENNCKRLIPDALKLPHPSFILKSGGKSSSLAVKAAREISELIKEIADGKKESSKKESSKKEGYTPRRLLTRKRGDSVPPW